MIANQIIMVRPACFGFNSETASDNAFQANKNSNPRMALAEFDYAVEVLRSKGIDVKVMNDDTTETRPDAIFPNNWFAFLPTGEFILFPMMALNRRTERRNDWINVWKTHRSLIDLSEQELAGKFLEGTGSIVFDHHSKLAYLSRSLRSNEYLFRMLCEKIKYQPIVFDAIDPTGKPYYHTNVVMSVGFDKIVLAQDCIPEGREKSYLLSKIKESGKAIVELTIEQVNQFCGNVLQVSNSKKERFWVISSTAYKALTESQKINLSSNSELLCIPVSTIEQVGGGSIRCMIAEYF